MEPKCEPDSSQNRAPRKMSQRCFSSEMPGSRGSEPASFVKLRTVPTLSNVMVPCAQGEGAGSTLGDGQGHRCKGFGGEAP